MNDENKTAGARKHNAQSNQKPGWTNIVDAAVKLIGAVVAVAVAIIAGNYQSSMTTSNLLVQREQADSNLRTGMFKDLVTPLIASKDGNISLDRERLLVELLALNFDEHFELKPLFIHIDDRLATEESDELNVEQRAAARHSLRSVAGRVIQHQIASLSRADSDSRPELQTCIYYFRLEDKPANSPRDISPVKRPCSYRQDASFDDMLKVESPNGVYTLSFTIAAPDNWQEQRFRVSMTVNENNKNDGDTIKEETNNYFHNKHLSYLRQVISPEFSLTWFDFPFSDNTLLADGTRFSLVMDSVERENVDASVNKATFKLIWFPVDYFSPQERPVNHRQFRERLGLQLE